MNKIKELLLDTIKEFILLVLVLTTLYVIIGSTFYSEIRIFFGKILFISFAWQFIYPIIEKLLTMLKCIFKYGKQSSKRLYKHNYLYKWQWKLIQLIKGW